MSVVAVERWEALGTGVALALTHPHRLGVARAAVSAVLAEIDAACSRFRPDSEVRRLERRAGATTVTPLLALAIATSLRAARATAGLVDPTVGHAGETLDAQPDGTVPYTLDTRPSWESIELDPRSGAIHLPSGIRLDLGATGKALAADLAVQAAAHAAGCGVLVSLGGDIAVAGLAPSGGWPIRIAEDSHVDPTTADGETLLVHCDAIATSSTTVRCWRRADATLHHIIDPRTACPAAVTYRTVTVVAATCADANAASTAAIVMGAPAPEWLEARRLPARLVAADGTVTYTSAWPRPQALSNFQGAIQDRRGKPAHH